MIKIVKEPEPTPIEEFKESGKKRSNDQILPPEPTKPVTKWTNVQNVTPEPTPIEEFKEDVMEEANDDYAKIAARKIEEAILQLSSFHHLLLVLLFHNSLTLLRLLYSS